jgi:hypothetical protein
LVGQLGLPDHSESRVTGHPKYEVNSSIGSIAPLMFGHPFALMYSNINEKSSASARPVRAKDVSTDALTFD